MLSGLVDIRHSVASVFARLVGYLYDSLLAEMIKVDRNLSVRQGLVIDFVITDVVHDLDAVTLPCRYTCIVPQVR